MFDIERSTKVKLVISTIGVSSVLGIVSALPWTGLFHKQGCEFKVLNEDNPFIIDLSCFPNWYAEIYDFFVLTPFELGLNYMVLPLWNLALGAIIVGLTFIIYRLLQNFVS